MKLKEDEAKTKWCPHARFNGDNIAESGDLAKCIGSDCAMWIPYKYWETTDGRIYDNKVVDEGEWVEGGFCGLIKEG